ncbi:PRAME family member 8-like [Mesocricetus auratus]|uniref:PRAME family member 8-like n=1 Tax=Mesocricetus auratus TaxID=10036 RepID=A0ABM2XLT6_MESAU|nr:PRAME family member 8-like [Mesocricetus auratus]
MSIQTPGTLRKQASQALLRNEELAISALEQLPMELFPELFKEAFKDRHTRIVKAMVAAWPFPCLPVGTLMKTPDLESFQAVLDAVDMQLARKFHARREKIKELDLRKGRHDFWTIWTGTEDGDCSESGDEEQVVKVLPRYAVRRRLKVITDLCLRLRLDEEQAYFLQWAQQRKGSLQLCCVRMKIWALPLCTIKDILSVFHPRHIEDLELSMGWDVSTLALFASCLGQMRSLRKLSLARAYKNTIRTINRTADREEKCVRKLVSQFSKLHCLQHLSLNGIYFLRDHVKQVLRCLRSPLETLSITSYILSESDLNYVPCCHSLCQLKHLDMRGVVLLALDPMPLRLLLETVAHSLQSLDLQGCKMKDSQLTLLTPALSWCTNLTKFNLYDNDFSVNILKDHLLHTANWSKMNGEQYPAPLECYDDFGYIDTERFLHICLELMNALRAQRQPKRIVFATDTCRECGMRCVYDLGPRLCPCWQ